MSTSFAVAVAWIDRNQLILGSVVLALKRFPSDLNRWDSQEAKDGRVFVH
jgi:hypothetical protein